MTRAIIGHTGFVGGNLITQTSFEEFYNSRNIETIQGKEFDFLVCSGAPAAKWLANKEPEKDRDNLQKLMTCLEGVQAKKVILISSVDVYPVPIEVDEDTPIAREKCQPYGRHRLELEEFIGQKFPSLIIRLPGLFGQGLKKNIIYDLLNNNIGDWIHKDSIFQFYNLDHLWQDLQVCLKNNLTLVNFATAPLSVAQVAQTCFKLTFTHSPAQAPAHYDLRSKYAHYFPKAQDSYLYGQGETLAQIKNFVNQYQGK